MVNFGDALNKAKDLASEHADKVEGALDKVADVVDEKTGGKFSEQIDGGVDAAKNFLGGNAAETDAAPEA